VRYRLGQRQRFGVALTFLGERIEPGSRLGVYVQKAHGFVWPQGLARPMIKVGPGTGIVPFCAFLQERAASHAMG
jgi:sulfite reductase (NADPH) flavoprotein alpha-component